MAMAFDRYLLLPQRHPKLEHFVLDDSMPGSLDRTMENLAKLTQWFCNRLPISCIQGSIRGLVVCRKVRLRLCNLPMYQIDTINGIADTVNLIACVKLALARAVHEQSIWHKLIKPTITICSTDLLKAYRVMPELFWVVPT